jgi:hypothetical protein
MASLLLRILGALPLGAASTRLPYEYDSLRPKHIPATGVTLSMNDYADIRLLELYPGKDEAPITCRMHRYYLFPLDRSYLREFEALSYTWGDPEQTHRIVCDGKEMRVTENLYAALRSLRYPNHSRLLWVDAICINQADIEEKSDQVGMMDDLYGIATSAIVFLGEESDDNDLAIDFVENLTSLLQTSRRTTTFAFRTSMS